MSRYYMLKMLYLRKEELSREHIEKTIGKWMGMVEEPRTLHKKHKVDQSLKRSEQSHETGTTKQA